MKIIISPAKKMNVDEDSLEYENLPVFIKDSKKLMEYIKSLSYDEAKKLWKTNDKITRQNMERFAYMELDKSLTPAIFSYEGIQYQHISPSSLEDYMLDYICRNLRILSGFYGILRPMDGVVPYRLEMQSKINIGSIENLYDFWAGKLYDELIDDSRIIINLASKEYSKCIEKYLKKNDRFINIYFYEISNDKLLQKATYAKIIRGEMIRFMAENNIENHEEIKKFKTLDYVFKQELSDENKYVFVKDKS